MRKCAFVLCDNVLHCICGEQRKATDTRTVAGESDGCMEGRLDEQLGSSQKRLRVQNAESNVDAEKETEDAAAEEARTVRVVVVVIAVAAVTGDMFDEEVDAFEFDGPAVDGEDEEGARFQGHNRELAIIFG